MWIARNQEELIRKMGREFPVVFVTGARQTGKTSILTHLFRDSSYVTFDDPAKAAEAENAPSDFLRSLKLPAIIDEAQYVPGLFRHIKVVVDEKKKKGQFFITGSQNFSLMQNLTESLAGRCGIVNLHSLSAGEVMRSRPKTSIEDYISMGGFPALHADSEVVPQHWYPSYIATYLERDVRNILRVGTLREFNRFLRAAAIRTAQTLSLSDLARDISVSPNTIKSWISVLQASHIAYLLEPYHRNLGKRLVKSPKLYFLDTGLVAYLMGISTWQDIINSPLAGALWETYAFNQIYRHLLTQGMTNPALYYWRTSAGQEVDFVIEKGGRFVAIEAKLTGSPGVADVKGFHALRQYYGAESIIKGYVLCKVGEDFSIGEKIKATNGIVLDF